MVFHLSEHTKRTSVLVCMCSIVNYSRIHFTAFVFRWYNKNFSIFTRRVFAEVVGGTECHRKVHVGILEISEWIWGFQMFERF